MTASVEVFPSARPVPKPASAVGEALSAYCLAGPAAFLLLCLFVLPIGGVLVIAVTDWQFGARTMSFVGRTGIRLAIGQNGHVRSPLGPQVVEKDRGDQRLRIEVRLPDRRDRRQGPVTCNNIV